MEGLYRRGAPTPSPRHPAGHSETPADVNKRSDAFLQASVSVR